MAVFPMFVDLQGKRCLVVGGGNVAERKVETLLEFDAAVTVVSPQLSEKLMKYHQEARIKIAAKTYDTGDLEGAVLVVAATSDRAVNEKIYQDAAKQNIPVNVADNPQHCTFIFPAVVRRGDLVVGISTSGGYPALAKCMKEKIEAVIPNHYGSLLQTLKECRSRAAVEISDPKRRRELMGRLVEELSLIEDDGDDTSFHMRIENIFGEYNDEKGN